MSENNNSLVPSGQEVTAISDNFGGMVDLAALAKRMEAQSFSGGSGGSGAGGSYPTRGMVKLEMSKDGGGRLGFTDPFSGDYISGKSVFAVIVNWGFTLERWPSNGEVIEGLNMEEYAKKPICRLAHYTDPTTNEQSKNGWLQSPILSAYHATQLPLGELVGTQGWDGQHPGQKCKDCPLAQKGLASEDKKCKPSGVVEVVLFGVDAKQLVDDKDQPRPVSAYLRLPLSSLVQLVSDLEDAEKRYAVDLKKQFGFYVPMLLTWRLDARVDTKGSNKWAVVSFNTHGYVTQELSAMVKNAREATAAILNDAADSNSQQAAGAGALGAPAQNAAPPQTPPASSGGAPF